MPQHPLHLHSARSICRHIESAQPTPKEDKSRVPSAQKQNEDAASSNLLVNDAPGNSYAVFTHHSLANILQIHKLRHLTVMPNLIT
jgi:hypothetical protein